MAEPTDTPTPPPGFVPAEPTPPPGFVPLKSPGLLESFGRGAVEGATFGFDDKLGLDKERRETSRKANPWTHFAGEMVGGALPMLGAALLPTGATQAAAAGRGAQLATKGAGLVRSALVPGEIGTAGQAIGQGAKIGTVYGGLSGAGHAEDGSALSGALKGAVEGAALGVPLGLAGHGIFRGAQALGGIKAGTAAETEGLGSGAISTAVKRLERDRITPQELIDQIKTEFPDATQAVAGGPGQPLARRFWGDIQNKQPITSDQVEEVVRRAMAGESAGDISKALSPGGKGTGPGPDAVQSLLDELAERHLGPLNLVDRTAMVRTGSGDNTQMTMRAAAATPGEHVGIARENFLERQLGQGNRLFDLFAKTLGSPDFESVAAIHSNKLQAAGTRLYNDAFASEKPFDLAPIFTKWQAQFDRMRGVIPDSIRSRLNSMMWQEKNAAGQLVKTPPENLQGFMYAREGLRDLIGEMPQGNNLRRHLTGLYNEMTDEVARTNPVWKKANDVWRDGKGAEDAMNAGANLGTRLNAKNREHLGEFTAAEKDAGAAAKELRDANKPVNAALKADPNYVPTPAQQSALDAAQAKLDAADARMRLFKVGLVRSLSDRVANRGETNNLTRELLLPGARQMLTKVLGNDAEQFFKALRAEAAMHRTYSSQFGSQTTPLREAVDELNFAPSFEASWKNLGLGKILQLAQEYAARTINAGRNKDLMELYTRTDPLRQLRDLQAMQQLHQARSTLGNQAGRPAIGASGPLLDAVVGSQTQEPPRPAIPPYRRP